MSADAACEKRSTSSDKASPNPPGSETPDPTAAAATSRNWRSWTLDTAFWEFDIYNLPPAKERARLRVELKSDEAAILPPTRIPAIPEASSFSGKGQCWWYQGEFYLPFAFTNLAFATRPILDDQLLALIVLTDYGRVRQAKAWFNGTEVELKKHFYRRTPSKQWCYYLNLMENETIVLPKIGDNTLAFWFEWERE